MGQSFPKVCAHCKRLLHYVRNDRVVIRNDRVVVRNDRVAVRSEGSLKLGLFWVLETTALEVRR